MEAENNTEPTRDTVSGAAAGVCVLTNQSRMDILDTWALQRQELKHSISDSGQNEKTDVFSEH